MGNLEIQKKTIASYCSYLISWHFSTLFNFTSFPTHSENIVHQFVFCFLQMVLLYNHVYSKLKS